MASPLAEPAQHARHVVLRNGEHHGGRLQLGDHHEAVRIRRMHDVAGIHLPQSDAAPDRRGHAGIGELQPGAVDRALVRLHRPFVLAHQRLLRVDLLLRDRILREERAVALEVELRVPQQCLVLGHLPRGLRQLHLEGTWVDLGQQVAGLHDLPLLERDAHQLAVDARLDDDHVARRDRAECVDVDVDAAFPRGSRNHGNGAGGRVGPAAASRRRIRCLGRPVPTPGTHGSEQRNGREPRPAALATCLGHCRIVGGMPGGRFARRHRVTGRESTRFSALRRDSGGEDVTIC